MKKLNVFIISQEEPFYIPKVIRYLAEHQNKSFQIVGATRLKPHRKNKTMRDWLKERTQIYTYWELIVTTLYFVYCKLFIKLLSKFGVYNPYAVNAIYKKWKIEEFDTMDLNDDTYLDQLSKLNIDIVLSISPPQLFQKRLINLPNIICLNAHGTLLPRHRGVFGSWWMLYLNDEEVGTTIHTMEERLDAGEIVWQKAIPIPKNTTQYSIAYHTKKIMAEGLVETLENYSKDTVKVVPSFYEESYHRAPTKEQGEEFHKSGKRIVTLGNAKYVLARKFK